MTKLLNDAAVIAVTPGRRGEITWYAERKTPFIEWMVVHSRIPRWFSWLRGCCFLPGAYGEAAAQRFQSSVSPHCIKDSENVRGGGRHVSLGDERPGSSPAAAKPS